jgi:hypothetical protein
MTEAQPTALKLMKHALDIVRIHEDSRGDVPFTTNTSGYLTEIASKIMLSPKKERHDALDHLRAQAKPQYQGELPKKTVVEVGKEIAYAERLYPYKK